MNAQEHFIGQFGLFIMNFLLATSSWICILLFCLEQVYQKMSLCLWQHFLYLTHVSYKSLHCCNAIHIVTANDSQRSENVCDMQHEKKPVDELGT